jgi:uncharacterized protein YuzE
MVNLDLDDSGRVVGPEILDARTHIPVDLLTDILNAQPEPNLMIV